MVVYAIAAAGCVGSLIGAFFQVRWMALLWSLPIVCVLYGAVVVTGPLINTNPDAPAGLREAMAQLADISLLVPVLVAAAAGTLFASSLVGYVRTQQASDGEGADGAWRPRETRSIFNSGRSANRLLERTEDIRQRRTPAPPSFAPLPVYEIAPVPPPVEAPPTTDALRDEEAGAAPRRAPVEANRRREGRRRTLLAGELVFEDGVAISCTIADLSIGGARVRLASAWPKGELRTLHDLSNGLGHEVALSWRAGPFAGLRFTRSYSLQPRDA